MFSPLRPLVTSQAQGTRVAHPFVFGGVLCEQAKCPKNGLFSFSLWASLNYIQCYWKQLSSSFHYTGFFILDVGVFNMTHRLDVNLHKCRGGKKIVSLFLVATFVTPDATALH